MPIRSVIVGTGRYVPDRVVTNEDLTQWMETSDEWIQQRTGIRQRHWVPDEGGVGTSDLAYEATQIALKRAGWTAEDIDLIIFGTLSPDINFPGSGCLLQHKLGLESTPALDIRQQCSAFVYGLSTADAYIRAGFAKRILLVGAEVHSTGLERSTRGRGVTVIFGDGAGVVCLEASDTDASVGVLTSKLYAQGEFAELLMTEAPSSKNSPRIDAEMIADGRHYPVMDGGRVFKQAVRRIPDVIHEVVQEAGLSINDVDLFVPHQANLRINQFVQKTLDIGDDRMVHTIQQYGNTTAASIPMALDVAVEDGRVKPGSTILFYSFGAGLTWGANLYRVP